MIPVYGLMKFLHDLATVTWFGGLFTTGIILVPVARTLLGPGVKMKKFMDVFQRRLTKLVYVSMVVLILSGVFLARHNPAFGGFFRMGNTYSEILTAKHILVVMMIAIGLVRSLVVGRKGQPQGRTKTKPLPQQTQKKPQAELGQEKLKMVLLYVNILLGVIVLLLSAYNAALPG